MNIHGEKTINGISCYPNFELLKPKFSFLIVGFVEMNPTRFH